MSVIRRAVPLLALAAACVLLVALALDNRRLRSQHVELFRRSIEAHPGMVVPEVVMPTLSGPDVIIGAPAQSQRQVLFFFTTTCPYCEASLPAIQQVATAARDEGGQFVAVALDTLPAAGVRARARAQLPDRHGSGSPGFGTVPGSRGPTGHDRGAGRAHHLHQKRSAH